MQGLDIVHSPEPADAIGEDTLQHVQWAVLKESRTL